MRDVHGKVLAVPQNQLLGVGMPWGWAGTASASASTNLGLSGSSCLVSLESQEVEAQKKAWTLFLRDASSMFVLVAVLCFEGHHDLVGDDESHPSHAGHEIVHSRGTGRS